MYTAFRILAKVKTIIILAAYWLTVHAAYWPHQRTWWNTCLGLERRLVSCFPWFSNYFDVVCISVSLPDSSPVVNGQAEYTMAHRNSATGGGCSEGGDPGEGSVRNGDRVIATVEEGSHNGRQEAVVVQKVGVVIQDPEESGCKKTAHFFPVSGIVSVFIFNNSPSTFVQTKFKRPIHRLQALVP